MTSRDKQVGGSHYKNMTVQPWEAMDAWMTPEEMQGYLRGTAIAYLARTGHKDAPLLEVKKAKHVLEALIEHLEKRKRGKKHGL